MPLSPLDATPPLERLGSLAVDDFLDRYWQREPCVLRGVFPGFVPELDESDIAGLACEDLAESRLVTGTFPAHDWTVRHGPFDEADLTALPGSDWTLLVQDVEKHYPPLTRLLARFAFVPDWRLDDLMVSIAAPGGSVGPHVDQYDVFLLQASGRRHWSVARTFEPEILPDGELRVLRAFSPESDWELEPGDILYLPPGVAHHGVALDLGMTWSIGLRAPSAADLALALGECRAERPDEGGRYTDPPGAARGEPGQVGTDALRGLRDLLSPGAEFDDCMGRFLTTWRQAHQPAPPEPAPAAGTVAAELRDGTVLRRNPWSRFAWIRGDHGACLYASGTAYPCRAEEARTLCAADAWTLLGDAEPSLCDLLVKLVIGGHVYFDRHAESPGMHGHSGAHASGTRL